MARRGGLFDPVEVAAAQPDDGCAVDGRVFCQRGHDGDGQYDVQWD